MLKRIVIDLSVVLAFIFLVVGSVLAYAWIKERPERAKRRAEAEAFLADLTGQKNALVALGDVELDPSKLTLAILEQKLHLHQQAIRPHGPQNTTTLGWVCGNEHCAIYATFVVPFGWEIPSTMIPARVFAMAPLLANGHNVAVGGVHLGEPVEKMKEFCQKRGYGLEAGFQRITWDKDWTLMWSADTNGKIRVLLFANNRMMHAKTSRAVHSLATAGVGEKATK